VNHAAQQKSMHPDPKNDKSIAAIAGMVPIGRKVRTPALDPKPVLLRFKRSHTGYRPQSTAR